MSEIMQFMAYGELADIFKVADSVTSLYYDNRIGCGSIDITTAIYESCAEETEDGKPKCSFGTIFSNLFTNHLIEVMGSGSTLANAVEEF